jgi:hypothetical protein
MLSAVRWRVLLGAGLIVAGLFSLLDALDILDVGGLGWGLLFAFVGAAFVYVFAANRRANWWAIIPGLVMLGLGALIAVNELFPRLDGNIGAGLFLGSIGLAFLIVYLNNRSFWWAIIPMGVMASLTMMLFAEALFRFDVAWLFMLGLAATFGVLLLIPVDGKRMTWPVWPAGALLAVSMLILITTVNLAGYVVPLVLIVLGGFLVWRALARR